MVGWAYIVMMVVVLPALVIQSAIAISAGKRPLPDRPSLHRNAIILLALLLGAALTVGRLEGIWLIRPFAPDWRDVAAIVGFLAIAVSVLHFNMRKLDDAHREVLERIAMSDWRNPRQRRSYLFVAIMSGIAAEIVYRGVLIELLQRHTGSWAASVAVASIAFGATHAVQGWRNAISVAGFAFLFHVIVLFTGDLYAVIVAHASYDLIAGFIFAENGLRRRAMALRPDPAAAASGSTD